MKKYLKFIAITSVALLAISASAEVFNLESPNGKLKLAIDIENDMKLSATIDGKVLVKDVVFVAKTPRINRICGRLPYSLDKRFYRAEKPCCDFNQLELSYTDFGYKAYIRAYNDAIAFRIELKEHPYTETIISETFNIPCSFDADFAEGTTFFKIGDNKVAFVETETCWNYPQMRFSYDKKAKILKSNFKTIKNSDEFESDYIFKVGGKAMFLPWRAFTFISNTPQEQVNSLKKRLSSNSCCKKN